jgi:glycine/D-amino acid oxidase-like deaminating enzyme
VPCTFVNDRFDSVVIGGGFYGSMLAIALAESGGHVALVEKEAELMTRASYGNQARVHNGYHYPRSYLTALRSTANFPLFISEFYDCIDDSFDHVYAIARNNSKVNAKQFRRFCTLIDAPLRPVPDRILRLFNRDLIEDAFCVTEYAFDAGALRRKLYEKLSQAGVTLLRNTPVDRICRQPDGGISVELQGASFLTAVNVIACAYASTNDLLRRSGLDTLRLKHELAEVALIAVPSALQKLGVTVMDGPFFSTMPFPPRGVHSLTHVRYTPHCAWRDPGEAPKCPPDTLSSRHIYMLKDAQRYLPILRESCYVDSLFEVKAMPIHNEVDDGRPIVFKKHYGMENFSVVMGSKIDNIYDAMNAARAAGLLGEVKHGAHA